DPGHAKFTDFIPFWEFVEGPINAGTFGPGDIDKTFGPDVRYQSVQPGMKQNRPPTEGKQYYGMAAIDGATEVMTMSLHDITVAARALSPLLAKARPWAASVVAVSTAASAPTPARPAPLISGFAGSSGGRFITSALPGSVARASAGKTSESRLIHRNCVADSGR